MFLQKLLQWSASEQNLHPAGSWGSTEAFLGGGALSCHRRKAGRGHSGTGFNFFLSPLCLDQKSTAESQGVIIVAIIVAILVVAVLGAVIYFLHKKGKIPCGRAGKQDM